LPPKLANSGFFRKFAFFAGAPAVSYLELLKAAKALRLLLGEGANEFNNLNSLPPSTEQNAKEVGAAKKAKKAKKAPDPLSQQGFTPQPFFAGLAKDAKKAPEAPPSYAFPWPDALPGLGRRTIGAFAPCEACGTGTWVRYGRAVLCLPCARRWLEDDEA
jgi:hypothetical protein